MDIKLTKTIEKRAARLGYVPVYDMGGNSLSQARGNFEIWLNDAASARRTDFNFPRDGKPVNWSVRTEDGECIASGDSKTMALAHKRATGAIAKHIAR